MKTTVGQLLVNGALPESLRDYDRVLDKSNISKLLSRVAKEYPEQYREINQHLDNIGWRTSQETGGMSFGLQHLLKSQAAAKLTVEMQAKLDKILADPTLSEGARDKQIVAMAGGYMRPMADAAYDDSVAEKNPLGMQVTSGARGNRLNLSRLRGSDILYTDHRDRAIPFPVTRSYSEGLRPWEYWAGSYGARRGVIAAKMSTADTGYLGKQLSQAAHRLVITDLDGDGVPDMPRGLPADVGDPGNEGALLARDTGPYLRNTVLTAKILADLRHRGMQDILVRSPLTGGSPDGGVYARDVGVRERGILPGRGENVGMAAAQSMAEPITQGALSVKHTGGVAGQVGTLSGFARINQTVQGSKTFRGGAIHAQGDGTVDKIVPAPAGGNYVIIGGAEHHVPANLDIKVKPGDYVEAGDQLSEGVPNPSEFIRHKGIGEGRRKFVEAFQDALQTAGQHGHRRNIELVARGLLNHVRMTGEHGNYIPDDVVPYSEIEHSYQPRPDAREGKPAEFPDWYLEKPVLHYSIGTKIRPSVIKMLGKYGIDKVSAHSQEPPFVPEYVRGATTLQYDQDWMTRMYGSGLKGSLLDAAHRGDVSNENSTSFVPSLARGVDFGKVGPVHKPEAGWAVKTSEASTMFPGTSTPGAAPGSAPGKPAQPSPKQTTVAPPKPVTAPTAAATPAAATPAAPKAPGMLEQIGSMVGDAGTLFRAEKPIASPEVFTQQLDAFKKTQAPTPGPAAVAQPAPPVAAGASPVVSVPGMAPPPAPETVSVPATPPAPATTIAANPNAAAADTSTAYAKPYEEMPKQEFKPFGGTASTWGENAWDVAKAPNDAFDTAGNAVLGGMVLNWGAKRVGLNLVPKALGPAAGFAGAALGWPLAAYQGVVAGGNYLLDQQKERLQQLREGTPETLAQQQQLTAARAKYDISNFTNTPFGSRYARKVISLPGGGTVERWVDTLTTDPNNPQANAMLDTAHLPPWARAVAENPELAKQITPNMSPAQIRAIIDPTGGAATEQTAWLDQLTQKQYQPTAQDQLVGKNNAAMSTAVQADAAAKRNAQIAAQTEFRKQTQRFDANAKVVPPSIDKDTPAAPPLERKPYKLPDTVPPLRPPPASFHSPMELFTGPGTNIRDTAPQSPKALAGAAKSREATNQREPVSRANDATVQAQTKYRKELDNWWAAKRRIEAGPASDADHETYRRGVVDPAQKQTQLQTSPDLLVRESQRKARAARLEAEAAAGEGRAAVPLNPKATVGPVDWQPAKPGIEFRDKLAAFELQPASQLPFMGVSAADKQVAIRDAARQYGGS